MARVDLWKTSGHEGFYADNMFTPMELDDANYRMKPMNCPFHILIYKDSLKSYRELPVRLGELGTVYRYERSGVMHGLLRGAASPRTTRTSSARRNRSRTRSAGVWILPLPRCTPTASSSTR